LPAAIFFPSHSTPSLKQVGGAASLRRGHEERAMPQLINVVSVTLPAVGSAVRVRGGLPDLTCPKCGGDFDILQPDSERPDRFIAVCRRCSSWAIVETDDESNPTTLAMLPDRLPTR
jgi:hypothetical protein